MTLLYTTTAAQTNSPSGDIRAIIMCGLFPINDPTLRCSEEERGEYVSAWQAQSIDLNVKV